MKMILEITKDGNSVCALWGPTLQEGICGFGGTVVEALQDFISNYKAELSKIMLSKEKPHEA